MRYAIVCKSTSGFVEYRYFCPAHLVESTKYWASQKWPDCIISVEVAD